MKAMFRQVNNRCHHGEVLAVGSPGCWECQWEAKVLKMKPPFTLECTDATGQSTLTKGALYTVWVVVRDASMQDGEHMGVMLRGAEGGLVEHIYAISRFDMAKEQPT